MRHFGSLLCFFVLAAASHGGSVSAQQSGGCTSPDPFAAIGGGVCVNGGWAPPSRPTLPEPTPPAPTPVQVISVGEIVTGTLTPNTVDAAGFHPAVYEFLYELTAPSDGFLTVQLSYDPTFGSAYLQLEDVGGSWPPPSIAMLEVVAGRTYRVLVSGDYYYPTFVPFVLTTSISPEAPAPVISCSGYWPGAGWVCVNGGWVPPDHPLAQTSAPPPLPPTPPAPPPTPPALPPPPPGAVDCVTVQPMSTWVCVNGGWVPPDHPLALSAPSTPTPPPPAPSGGCTTPDPFISIPGLIGVCIDGGWRPIPRGGG